MHVSCGPGKYAASDPLFRTLQTACRCRTLTIDMAKLDIDTPPGICDVFAYFFARISC